LVPAVTVVLLSVMALGGKNVLLELLLDVLELTSNALSSKTSDFVYRLISL